MSEPSKENQLAANQPDNKQPTDNEPGEPGRKPGIVQMFLSVAAAAFGVQSSKTRERDFTRGNPLAFILVGLIFTVALVLSILLVVTLVLR